MNILKRNYIVNQRKYCSFVKSFSYFNNNNHHNNANQRNFSSKIPSTNDFLIENNKDVKTTVRLNKAISIVSGISRREADKYIIDRKVSINGDLITNLATKINLETDEISIDGEQKHFNKEKMLKPRLWLCNKLRGELITTVDPLGRPTIYDRFESMNIPNARSLKYIGRLDRNTSGLILFTNDGNLKRFMENPKLSYILRTYQVTIEGQIQHNWLKWLQKGAIIDNVKYRPMKINVLRSGSDGSRLNELQMTLTEGKKNEIRKVLRGGGMPVKKLHRLQYGPYKIDGLNPGDVVEVKLNHQFLNQAKYTNDMLKLEKKRIRDEKKQRKKKLLFRGSDNNRKKKKKKQNHGGGGGGGNGTSSSVSYTL